MDIQPATWILNAGVEGLAALYRTGRTTPPKVARYYLDRISASNSALGAYVSVRQTAAMAEADASARRWASGAPLSPLDGVPIAVKANIAVAGEPFHAGVLAYAERVAEADAACIAALRERGAIILGLLNMDEGALGATGNNPWLGATHNPYRRGYVSGGSSAGAGAAVSAGLCAAAIGTDTMGSVRIPAAYCGCVGYKPRRGVISTEGVVPLSSSLDHLGVLARSVRDCERLVDGSNFGPPPSIGGMRLGIPSNLDELEIGEEVKLALNGLIRKLAEAGAVMAPVDFGPLDLGRLRRACLLATEVEAMAAHPGVATGAPGFSDTFAGMLRWGGRQPPEKIAQAYETMADAAQIVRTQLTGIAAMLFPIVPDAAFPFGVGAPAGLGDFATPANVAGIPAVAIPIGLSQGGLPLSIQCMGDHNRATMDAATLVMGMAGPIAPPPGWGLG